MKPEQPPQFNKTPIGEGKISNEQKAAIKFAAEIGRQIQQTCPEIDIDYRNGLTLSELVEKYNIKNRFGIDNMQTARVAVNNALKGYSGGSIDHYLGLIKDSDASIIGNTHKKEAGRKTGKFTRDTAIGIFGMNAQEKSRVSTEVGKNAYSAKTGIHALGYKTPPLSFETRASNGKKAAITRGFAVLSPEAETFIKGLDLNSTEYQNKRTKVTQVNLKRITEEVNKKFYEGKNIINADAISSFIRRIKKQNTP